MISDYNQFCFIMCTNDKQYMDECAMYISLLYIPDGYTVDFITIEGAKSMASAYNAAMNASPAKYKIYLHQDTMILNRYFLYNILKIFESDEDIGMIGMWGNVHLEDDAYISFDNDKYVGHNYSLALKQYISSKIEYGDYIYDVEAIDGFIMTTQYDIPWREDLFDSWDFYDISQSMEFHRLDYRVVVPAQTVMWCFHADDLTSSLFEYEKYRKIFIDEYGEDLKNYDIERKSTTKNEKREQDLKNKIKEYTTLAAYAPGIKKEIQKILDRADKCLKNQDMDGLKDLRHFFDEKVTGDAIFVISVNLRRVFHTLLVLEKEQKAGVTLTISDVYGIDDLKYKYVKCQMMMRRIEMDIPSEFKEEAFSYLMKDTVSPYFLGMLLGNEHSMFSQRKRVMTEICQRYLECGDSGRAKISIEILKENAEQ